MDRRIFEQHKEQVSKALAHMDASISQLQKGFKELQKSNFEFYQFIQDNYFDLEERVTKLERMQQDRK